jgi:tRNA threonylcarbamoyladenosine modification (KEOPS) complex Cgi121 subunit
MNGSKGSYAIAGAVSKYESDGKKIMERWSDRYQVQPMRADRIFGRAHLISSYLHAERAFRQERNRSSNLMTEALLFASFNRQISKAIELLGVNGQKEIALLIHPSIGDEELDEQLSSVGLVRDDTVIEITAEKLKEMELLGIRCDVKEAEKAVLQKIALSYIDI